MTSVFRPHTCAPCACTSSRRACSQPGNPIRTVRHVRLTQDKPNPNPPQRRCGRAGGPCCSRRTPIRSSWLRSWGSMTASRRRRAAGNWWPSILSRSASRCPRTSTCSTAWYDSVFPPMPTAGEGLAPDCRCPHTQHARSWPTGVGEVEPTRACVSDSPLAPLLSSPFCSQIHGLELERSGTKPVCLGRAERAGRAAL